jgi:hypothetical protein
LFDPTRLNAIDPCLEIKRALLAAIAAPAAAWCGAGAAPRAQTPPLLPKLQLYVTASIRIPNLGSLFSYPQIPAARAVQSIKTSKHHYNNARNTPPQVLQNRKRLLEKLPEIKKSLEAVGALLAKKDSGERATSSAAPCCPVASNRASCGRAPRAARQGDANARRPSGGLPCQGPQQCARSQSIRPGAYQLRHNRR